MNRLKIQRKKPFYLGIVLIVIGILLRWLIEQLLVSDNRIESSLYGTLIFAFQIVAVLAGLFLLIRQPALKLPKRAISP